MMGASAGGVGGVAQGNDLEVIQTEVGDSLPSCVYAGCSVTDSALTGSRVPLDSRRSEGSAYLQVVSCACAHRLSPQHRLPQRPGSCCWP